MRNRSNFHSKFDLEFLLNIGEAYKLDKNGMIKDVYDTEFEEIGLEEEVVQTEEDQFKQDQFYQEEEEPVEIPRQYFSNIIYPLNSPPINNSVPNLTLKLIFVNGYDCLESSQNVFYLKSQKILFNSATLGVAMDIKTRKQWYYGFIGQQQPSKSFQNYHKSSIISICYDPQTGKVATGSLGSNPEICVWDSNSMKSIRKFFQGKNTKAVSFIRFFMDCKYIITIDRKSSKQNHLRLWTEDGKKIKEYNTDGAVYGIATYQNNIGLATNKGAFKLSFDQDLNQFVETRDSYQFHTSVAFLNQHIVYCNTVGQILYKKEKKKIHDGFIFAITIKNNTIYTSGSQDYLLKVFNEEWELLRTHKLENYARSIDIINDKILVSIRKGKIIQINNNNEISVIINSHFSGESWGLCYDNKRKAFVTSGDDNKILHFDLKQKKVVKQYIISSQQKMNKNYTKSKLNSFPCSQQSRAIEVFGNYCAYVTNLGELYIKNIKKIAEGENNGITLIDMKPIMLKDKSECLRFSRDGKKLAVGCHNQIIYIFDVISDGHSVNLEHIGALTGHHSYICSIDFNEDATYLRSCGARELRFWDLTSMKEINLVSKGVLPQIKELIRGMSWVTTGKFNVNTAQLWKQYKDQDFVNRLAISNSKKFIALGEDENCVRIYRNPCVMGKYKKFRAHSHHVFNVCWSDDDRYLASLGGYDKCLMIWQVISQE